MEYPVSQARLKYDLAKWFDQGWNVFKAHIWQFVLLILIMVIPGIIVGGISGVASYLEASRNPNPAAFPLIPTAAKVGIAVVSALLGAAVSTPLIVGMAAVSLGAVRTGVFDWDRIWTGFRKWPAAFVIGLISGVLTLIPMLFPLLWIIFPIWLAVGLWDMFAAYTLSETGTDLGTAVNRGIELIKGNFWWAVLFTLVSGLIAVIGVIACCVGLFFTAAFYQALLAVAYNDLSSQLGAAGSEVQAQ